MDQGDGREVSPKVFLNSPLSHIAAQMLNSEIKRILVEEGFNCILSQDQLPPVPETDPLDVFTRNIELVNECDIVLTVLDSPGEGVVFELGIAYALRKPILAFRSDKQGYLGKVLEGLWRILPTSRRATTLEELRTRLQGLDVAEEVDDKPED